MASSSRHRQNNVAEVLEVTSLKENEAKQLSNGKWACTICSWWPVMDTLPMLAIHRSSKKHKEQAAIWEQKQRQQNASSQRQAATQQHTSTQSSTLASSASSSSYRGSNTSSNSNFHVPSSYPPSYPLSAHPPPIAAPFSATLSSASAGQEPSYYPYTAFANPEQIAMITKHQQRAVRENEAAWESYIRGCIDKGWYMDEKGVFHQDANVEYEEDDMPSLPPSTPLPKQLIEKYARKAAAPTSSQAFLPSAKAAYTSQTTLEVRSLVAESSQGPEVRPVDLSPAPLLPPTSQQGVKRKLTRQEKRDMKQQAWDREKELARKAEEVAGVEGEAFPTWQEVAPTAAPRPPTSMADNAYMLSIELPYKKKRKEV